MTAFRSAVALPTAAIFPEIVDAGGRPLYADAGTFASVWSESIGPPSAFDRSGGILWAGSPLSGR